MKDGRQQEMRARERKIVRKWSEKAEVDVYRERGEEQQEKAGVCMEDGGGGGEN
jgi:hypothetical protein